MTASCILNSQSANILYQSQLFRRPDSLMQLRDDDCIQHPGERCHLGILYLLCFLTNIRVHDD